MIKLKINKPLAPNKVQTRFGSICFALLLLFQILLLGSCSGDAKKDKATVTWNIAELLKSKQGITVLGNPEIIDSPYGKAVHFDGEDDGILVDKMPLKGFSEYTIEMQIRFDGGNWEQRYFHTGKIQKGEDRSLMEMRANKDTWYLDGMFESKGKWVVLMDSTLVHPLGKWYHIAFTVKDGYQATYVDGQKELEGHEAFAPFYEGATSIGVRQNKVSWFKGAIYSIQITDKALIPSDFRILK